MLVAILLLTFLGSVLGDSVVLNEHQAVTKPIKCDRRRDEKDNSPVVEVDLSYTASGPVSFILVDGCATDAYASPMNYYKDLSVVSRTSFGGSMSQNTGIDVCYLIRNDAINQTVTLDYTMDVTCNPNSLLREILTFLYILLAVCCLGILFCVAIGISKFCEEYCQRGQEDGRDMVPV